jgi:uncharacterized protein YbbK (DUF523 family)
MCLMNEIGRILVSSCLIGRPVRYDGSAKSCHHDALSRWAAEGRLVSVCPEMLAGFATPRPAAEIAERKDGGAVLVRQARVVEGTGNDVTEAFIEGAMRTLNIAVQQSCQFALLTDGSPSCGSNYIYDGGFSGRRHDGEGVVAALLRRNGIAVFSPDSIEDLISAVAAFDASKRLQL